MGNVLSDSYYLIPGGRRHYMSRLWLLPEQQKREFRVDHLNPGHPTAEQFLIAPAKGRNVSQPVTREESLVFVNDGILPARLEEWERQALSGSEKLPKIDIPESTDSLHHA